MTMFPISHGYELLVTSLIRHAQIDKNLDETNPNFRRTYAKWYFPARDKFGIKTLGFSTLQNE